MYFPLLLESLNDMEHEKDYQSTVLAIYYFLNKCYIFVMNVITDIVVGLPETLFSKYIC